MKKQVTAALEDVRNVLKRDGGDLELVDITDDNIVKVRLQGHCIGCPGAQMTLRMIVEQILGEAVPEIQGVDAVD
ncbi:MAG: NifU family protein [Eubacteriales bacterium]|nr:NifU family protein [Eubacteriales bacterium]